MKELYGKETMLIGCRLFYLQQLFSWLKKPGSTERRKTEKEIRIAGGYIGCCSFGGGGGRDHSQRRRQQKVVVLVPVLAYHLLKCVTHDYRIFINM
jgi:hypothetical protein